MIGRKLMAKLVQWKNRKRRKPLIIRGARQVGKTTLVHQFAKTFSQYIYLNLETQEDRAVFLKGNSFEQLVEAIFFLKGKSRNDEDTLIFIDEIQTIPSAINQLRYFYEKTPELYVIAAGSLLETLLSKQLVIPVGRVEFMMLRPFSFEEFLWASEDDQAAEIIHKVPIPIYAHQKMLQLFHRYTLIGGMPEIVSNYIEAKDLIALKPVYDSIISTYIEDVEKYAKEKQFARVIRHVITNSYWQAANRIKFQGFGQSNYKSREIKEALLVLEKALLIQLIYPTTSVKVPIIPDFRKSPKLHFLDTGLVNYYTGLQVDIFGSDDINAVHGGKVAEHIVAQELLTIDESVLYHLNFWVREKTQSNAEVDFVYQYKNRVVPVEVKSGMSGRLRSLHQFIDRSPNNIAVRLYAGELKIENLKTTKGKPFILLNLPYYLSTKISAYLEWLEEGGAV